MRRLKLYPILILLSMISFSCADALTEEEILDFTEKGNLIATKTADELSGKLMVKMKEGGIPLAVEYCNTAALPLTSDISKKEGVKIKRTSHKVRNPLNHPDQEEAQIINEFLSKLDQNISPKPLIQLDSSGDPHYYAPILVGKKCLVCHGTLNKELSVAADSIIKMNYPNDLATGFKEGDLRGIWSISFYSF